MIIGNGLIARKFEAYKNDSTIIIFASGVSNSKNSTEADYQREKDLLEKTMHENKDKILVYFSTCSVYDPEEEGSAYVLHKKEMEKLIQQQEAYYIFRVSNLAGKTPNTNTILNYLYFHIRNHNHFYLWENAVRNLIDIDDMYRIADYILQNQLFPGSIINIANPKSYKVTVIVKAIEQHIKLKANFTAVQKGQPFSIDISPILSIIDKLHINFGKSYLPNLLEKYIEH